MTTPTSDPERTEAPLGAWLADSQGWSEAQLERWFPAESDWPAGLREACRYALLGGGKRLRPALVRLFATSFGGTDEAASRPAAAVEMIHTYSLVHDDLPCMDDDDLRRGRPTCHKVYGEAMAVLVGDALLTEAFVLLSEAERDPALLTRTLARASGGAGMVGGQVLDMSLCGSAASIGDVRRVHAAKTAALIGASCELGAVAAGATEDQRSLARQYGVALGLAFQAIDDWLDATGDAATLGKTPGKDQELDRSTTVAVLGLDGAREEAMARGAEARGAARLLGFSSGSLPVQLVDRLLQRES